MKMKHLIIVLSIVSFSKTFAQADLVPNIQTPEDATAFLKQLSETYKDGDEKLLPLLIEKGADVNVNNKYGMSPLFMAVLANSTDGVRILLEASANPNVIKPKSYETPLFFAAQKKNIDIVKALIKAKARVNLAFGRGLTPLFIATVQNADDIVNVLIEAGANPDIYDKKTQTSPLYIAAENGHYKNVSALLKAGAKIDHQKTDGSTALYIASSKGHSAIVLYLIANKANPHLCKIDGDAIRSPLLEATENGHGQIVQWLKEGLPSCSNRLEKNNWDLFWMPGIFSMEVKAIKVKNGHKNHKIIFKGNPNNQMSFDCYVVYNDDIANNLYQIFVDGSKIYEGRYTKVKTGLSAPTIGPDVIDAMSNGRVCELRKIGNRGGEFLAGSFEFSLEHFSENLALAKMNAKKAQEDEDTGRCINEGFSFGF